MLNTLNQMKLTGGHSSHTFVSNPTLLYPKKVSVGYHPQTKLYLVELNSNNNGLSPTEFLVTRSPEHVVKVATEFLGVAIDSTNKENRG